jgi:hypothetical protein
MSATGQSPLRSPDSTGEPGPERARPLLPAIFTLTAFTGACLLFVVQPMIARMLLPSYGGSATVWSTSSLFFQVLLLLGYLYAHLSTQRLGRAWQPKVHLLVLLVPLVVLPIALPADAAPTEASPALWLLRTLAIVIGLPFVVVSTTGPLLQTWYSWTDAHRAEDPYFLFAASNLGSFGGLLAYPFLIEPHLTLAQQRLSWSVGFGVFVVLTGTCGVATMRSRGSRPEKRTEVLSVQGLDRIRVLRWLALAFLPSALMLAVTAHVSTNIAPIPLLWVIPLAIYLGTFVAAFARTSREVPRRATHLAVGAAFAAAIGGLLPGGFALAQVALQMVMLALVGYAAHARLAADRPSTDRLTTYYLVVASGGALGGLLNGLLAPVVFDRVLEYPLVMVCVPLLMIGVVKPTARDSRSEWARFVAPVVLAAVALGGLTGWVSTFVLGHNLWALGMPCLIALALALGLRLAYEYKLLIVALVVIFGSQIVFDQVTAIDQRRTFFGSYRVSEAGGQHRLVHGTTVHGTQFLDQRASEPTSYYARTGPLGEIFRQGSYRDIAIIGLGAGTIAAYGEPGMRMTYFEIDPEIVDVAEDPAYFTYLRDSGAEIRTVVGDGRLKLGEEPEGGFDLIVLDAFSSDAIPMHLLTVEAMRTYADHLSADGRLVVHISNRVFDLEPVLVGAAHELGWSGAVGYGGSGEGASVSEWAVLTPRPDEAAGFAASPGWTLLGGPSVTWTDDYSSILSVLR